MKRQDIDLQIGARLAEVRRRCRLTQRQLAATMGRVLHNWDSSIRTMLLEKAYRAISPGGALIIYDPLIDEQRRLPHGLLSSLNMLSETASGSEYTATECKSWMIQAGFREIWTEPLGDMHGAVIGTKID